MGGHFIHPPETTAAYPSSRFVDVDIVSLAKDRPQCGTVGRSYCVEKLILEEKEGSDADESGDNNNNNNNNRPLVETVRCVEQNEGQSFYLFYHDLSSTTRVSRTPFCVLVFSRFSSLVATNQRPNETKRPFCSEHRQKAEAPPRNCPARVKETGHPRNRPLATGKTLVRPTRGGVGEGGGELC